MVIEPLAMSIPEFAKKLGISKNYAYILARQKQITTIRLGRRVLVPAHVVEKMLEGR